MCQSVASCDSLDGKLSHSMVVIKTFLLLLVCQASEFSD